MLIDANYFISHKLVFETNEYKIFYVNDERKNDNGKSINVTAFEEHLSLTLFSKLYFLNMKTLGYWYINIKVIRIKSESGGCLCKCWLQKYVTHYFMVVF